MNILIPFIRNLKLTGLNPMNDMPIKASNRVVALHSCLKDKGSLFSNKEVEFQYFLNTLR